MKRIFFFGFNGFSDRMRANTLKMELEKQGYECFIKEQPCYILQIGEIVSNPEVEVLTDLPQEKLPEPFILFCGMRGEILDIALRICKGNTNAVLTVSNSRMTPCELSKHLAAEKRSLEQG